MKTSYRAPAAILAAGAALLAPRFAAAQTTEIDRIKDEGLNRSQVMQTLSYLCDVIGPRLTGSPGMKRANEWTRDRLTAFGLQNAALEQWGPFGRGWTLERFSAQVVAPQNIPLIAMPKAWAPGTNGPIEAPVVYFDVKEEADLEKYRGKLKGAVLLMSAPRTVSAHFEPEGSRWTDKQLEDLANRQPGQQGQRPGGARRGVPQAGPEQRAALRLASAKLKMAYDEGAAVLMDVARGDGGNIFVQQASVLPVGEGPAARRFSPWTKEATMLPQVAVSAEHYNRLVRMIQAGEQLRMNIDIRVKYHDDDQNAYNTVAEIPGRDKKDEIVMIGAHMDSWHGGTGATDNGVGVAVTMEAVRILKALNLQPRRTIRIALWSGEEQGLFGSKAYVEKHFGKMERPSSAQGTAEQAAGNQARPELKAKPAWEKLSAYFNLDNGTGKIRGIYAQGNEKIKPIFQEWLAPFTDMGAKTVTIANTSSTDHASFDAVGLPGFQFIQDRVEYDTRTHHSTQDVYERAIADDLKQASVIMAAFIYNAAMRDELLPRKPLNP